MPEYEDYLARAEEARGSAQILLENGKLNSAISEAYYSMYYAASALLCLKDLHPKKHKGVLALLGLEFINKGYLEEVYGRMLARDMQLREKADYDLSFRASKEEAESVVDDAGRFFDRIQKAVDSLKPHGKKP